MMNKLQIVSKRMGLLVLFLLTILTSRAQTYLTDVFKPVESDKSYQAYPTKGTEVIEMATSFKYKGGFTLGRLINTEQGDAPYAVFDLNGSYEQLSFVIGPVNWFTNGDGNALMAIRADGKRIFDKVVWRHDAPSEQVIDVKGVKQLRFEMVKGVMQVGFASVRLWKAGETFKPSADPQRKINANDRVQLLGQLEPYWGRMNWITKKEKNIARVTPTDSVISINRVKYKTGISCTCSEVLAGENIGDWIYFWLQKKFDKVSFIVGPRDNQASAASAWLTVKADNKIIYEKLVKQTDLAEMVVLDVANVNQLSFHSVLADTRFLGSITFGVVNIYAYPKNYDQALLPQAGPVNNSKSKLSQLPDMCKMVSNIPPYTVQGMAAYKNSIFKGESAYYTFSMGGEQFDEGFILTSGNTLFDDHVSAYYKFDLAGEFDYMSFTVGALTKRRTQSDDNIRIYVDDKKVLDTIIHVTWPNQRFVIPLNKCRTVTFAKPGTAEQHNSYFGVGDVTLYRGKVQDNSELFSHPKPECPDSIDLIDLCKAPYYHYVGRFLSTLTNFDFNDCFQNGESKRRFFRMQDGTQIYKGVMLETNIPFALENITPLKAAFMFLTGAGGAMSGGSDYGAGAGVTAGDGGVAGMIGVAQEAEKGDKNALGQLLKNGLNFGVFSLFSAGGHQSSACAFNPYGEYDELTFTIACKSPYVDPMRQVFEGLENPIKLITDPEGKTLKAPPVKFCVFADQVNVGEFWVYNEMKPTTVTVPINKCHQLMFWLECGEERSGQYVIYDMTVRKKK